MKAVTNFANDKVAFYINLTKELEIETHENTFRKTLRKIDFRRCIACFKFLIF